MKKETKFFNTVRKLIVLNDGDYYFQTDITFIGDGKYMCRGVDLDKNITTKIVVIEDENPEFKFANYLELLVDGKVEG
ncbi:hypothetical protein [Paenisporosarcina cavernae]|uniref:Uncharacterized protein n=1 Tax=Paenisporosarcina cavernae TaxID=2320858 RepID=A0A385YT33_9BACL|nr:hypothetical protein [Paenisporosarcina cavernae]AYC29651.1 hypothetical protein D3873_07020 [Paenisporosarcina cavernae]AYC30015.1 hypothetical protein D3873_09075 [Paenisporosarcina cavernae]